MRFYPDSPVKLSFLGIYTLVGVPLNIAQFITIRRKGKKCSSNEIFLASLAIADCCHLLQKMTFTILFHFEINPNAVILALMFTVFLTVSHL